MKCNVQILLFFACLVPVFVGAREETMEERKQRITRKYLRERVDITYSDTAVPDAGEEDEEVLASEKFQQSQEGLLERHEPGRAMPVPVPRPQPQMVNRNWLLAEDPELDDPYSDPFADPFMKRDSKDDLEEKDSWTDWGRKSEASPFGSKQREDQYNQRNGGFPYRQQSGIYDTTRQGAYDPRSEGLPYEQQPGTYDTTRRGAFDSRNEGLPYGQQSGIYGATRQETFDPRDPRATSIEGMKPRVQQQGQGAGPVGNYVPYKSSFQIQRDQQNQRQRGSYTEPESEYQRPNTFQQWKTKNATPFDPTSDNAFVNELMPKTRR